MLKLVTVAAVSLVALSSAHAALRTTSFQGGPRMTFMAATTYEQCLQNMACVGVPDYAAPQYCNYVGARWHGMAKDPNWRPICVPEGTGVSSAQALSTKKGRSRLHRRTATHSTRKRLIELTCTVEGGRAAPSENFDS
jgi:hypothetical protein